MKSSYSSKQFWPRSTLSSFDRPKKPLKIPSRKQRQPKQSLEHRNSLPHRPRTIPMPQPHPTRHPHAHNLQPIKEVSLSHPRRLPLRLPRPSRFFPLPSRIHRPPASARAGNLRRPPTAPRSVGHVGPRLRDRDASSPAKGAVSDPHPRQRDDFHKHPSDTH